MRAGFDRRDAAAYAAALALAAGVLITARLLVPQAGGTHQQLGLPDCAFQLLTGLPCPSCGLTTSFAHMARLEVARAAAVQPFGVVLFTVTALTVPAIGILLAARVASSRVLAHPGTRLAGWTLAALYLGTWVVRLTLGS
jgi:hypothetical protein